MGRHRLPNHQQRHQQQPPPPPPPPPPSQSSPSTTSSSSPLEKSCFVCHLFLIPAVATIVGYWIVFQDDPQKLDETVGYLQLPHPHYIKHIPVSCLLIFLAVPLLYCTANSLIVPNLQSTEILYDQYTKAPPPPTTTTTKTATTATEATPPTTPTTTTLEHNQSGLPPQ